MKRYSAITLLLILLLNSCSVKSDAKPSSVEEDLSKKFNHGKELFYKKKYTRALDDFNEIIMNARGSEIAVEARYYQAESFYELKQYNDAISSYEKFIDYSSDPKLVEFAMFKMCKSYFRLSSSYSRDQSNNDFAFIKLQIFIDQFPESEYVKETEELLWKLRLRKARKIYETGRLYLKLKEYDSAIIYFNDVIENYYDTKFSDEARISIIFYHLLQDKTDIAYSYYNQNSDSFIDVAKKNEAESLLENYNESGSWIRNKIRLYK